jgi:hypothetical protein
MKKIIYLIVFLLLASNAIAHSGGTNKCGGHNNRKTGDYHVHNWIKHDACYPKKLERIDEELENQISSDEVISNDEVQELMTEE